MTDTYISLTFIQGKICVPTWGMWKGHGGYIETGLDCVIDDDDVLALAKVIENKKSEIMPEVDEGCPIEESTYRKMGYRSFNKFSRESAAASLLVHDRSAEIYVRPRSASPSFHNDYVLETAEPAEIAKWIVENKALWLES